LKSEVIRAEPRAALFLHVLSVFAQRAVGCGARYCRALPKLIDTSPAGRGSQTLPVATGVPR
jgi:hypothetical protein